MTPIEQLLASQDELPPEVREAILALGPSAVAPLLEILAGKEVGAADSPSERWARMHTVELLIDLDAASAIAPMLDVLVETEVDDLLHEEILLHLADLGAPVLEPALARLDRAESPDVASSLIGILANLGVRDERIFEAICAEFEQEDLELGALHFGEYGDARALPLLEAAILQYQPDYSSAFWRHELTELLDAHDMLEGVLDEVLRAHIDRIDEGWNRRLAGTAHAGGKKVGRNDACPCGSGKKYKKCCLDKIAAPDLIDEEARQLAAFAAPLLDATDRSPFEVRQVIAFARVLWKTALIRDSAAREDKIHEMLRESPVEGREQFEVQVREMIERHREMFPEKHGPLALQSFAG